MVKSSVKVSIFGVGAIGSAIAYELIDAKNNVELKFYNRSQKEAIKVRGAGFSAEIPVKQEASNNYSTSADWLFVCIKEHHYSEALSNVLRLIKSKTKVVVIRNGLSLVDPFLPHMDASNILACSIDCPVQPAADGYFEMLGIPKLTVPKCALALELVELFRTSRVKIKTSEDFLTMSWEKVCESSSLGAIMSLVGETAWIFQFPELRDIFSRLLDESIEVALADGAKISKKFRAKTLQKLLTYPSHKGSSMLTDRLNGNVIELGAKTALIKQLASRYHIDVPMTSLVLGLLNGINERTLKRDNKDS